MLPRSLVVPFHTILHVHSYNVIVSYLGCGQPPLQLRLITFLIKTGLFVYIYLT